MDNLAIQHRNARSNHCHLRWSGKFRPNRSKRTILPNAVLQNRRILRPKHAHSTMNNLLLKAVTDRNARQLVEERGGYNGIDSLTSDELEQYQVFEDMVIATIDLNMSYQEIKSMVFKNKKTRTVGDC